MVPEVALVIEQSKPTHCGTFQIAAPGVVEMAHVLPPSELKLAFATAAVLEEKQFNP